MTKVTAYITIEMNFESENPDTADYFAKDYVEKLEDTLPHDSMGVTFRTMTYHQPAVAESDAGL